MVPKLWEEIARMNTELNRRKQLEPIDQQAMYKAEREFYINHCGEPDPKDGPLSKSLLGQRLAALEEKGIFYRPINRLLYKPTAERLQSGFLEYAAVELKRELDVIKSADLDWAILGPECEAIIEQHAIGADRYVGEEKTNRGLTLHISSKITELRNRKFEEIMAHAIRETEKEKQRVKEMMQRRTEGRQVYLEKREVAGREELGLERKKYDKLWQAAEQDESVPVDTVDHSVGRGVCPREFPKHNPELAKLGEPVAKAWLDKL